MTNDVYASKGFGGAQRVGRRPCLVVVDLNYAFTDAESALACDVEQVVPTVARLIETARAAGNPVVFTTIEYDEGGARTAQAFVAKAPALLQMTPGSRWAQVDERLAPQPGEPVLLKLFASAFFGTALAAFLAAEGCDSVMVVGASTSGCVRATAVDALQHGYSVVVPRDGVGDRAPEIHQASLRDLQAKYAEVVDTDRAVELLSQTRTS